MMIPKQDMTGRTALVLIDMQLGNFIGDDPIFAGKDLIVITQYMVQKAREAKVPIFYVLNNGGVGNPDEVGTAGWEVHPDIEPATEDVIVQKTTPDSFHKTELQASLDEKNIKKLVVMGLQTEYCIDATCRRGSTIGYSIQLVQDGHSTWDSDVLSAQKIIEHHNAVLGDWFVELVHSSKFEFER